MTVAVKKISVKAQATGTIIALFSAVALPQIVHVIGAVSGMVYLALMLCISCITGFSGCANPYQQETVTEQTAEKTVSNPHNVKNNIK